ncbi:hypothetical protein CRENBAI_024180 [Crenichthys baileyi]|uniref:Uncharacterized protein n=1 Tax=Crenichthys baileyi TaxID=28760 RepID=A0AAV9RWW0_9TELE
MPRAPTQTTPYPGGAAPASPPMAHNQHRPWGGGNGPQGASTNLLRGQLPIGDRGQVPLRVPQRHQNEVPTE